ncbi:hypothetical protein DPMN_194423 [Dreissena polymorpha]|uniref:Uncharacterized protein n=1 Tax=Dreissena polymorpha TaxID=45954 RepID=A0A9D4BDI6_DREPO|nr:hypothetical protein DPMN_194423 [Dreissena polymorpha]
MGQTRVITAREVDERQAVYRKPPHPFSINAATTSTTATDRKRNNRSVRASYRPVCFVLI